MEVFDRLREVIRTRQLQFSSTQHPIFRSKEVETSEIQEENVGFLSGSSSIDGRSDTDSSLYFDEKPGPELQPYISPKSTTALRWRSHFKEILHFLLPSFISSYIDPSRAEIINLRPTAYVDGLRGLAAWSVFNGHLNTVYCSDCGSGWGYGGQNYQFWRLPIAVLVNRGDFAVALFFVISGFALSLGPVAEMHKSPRDPKGFMAKLASSVFRRPFRLFVPAIASMIFTFILIRLHYVEYVQDNLTEYRTLVKGWDPISIDKPERLDTFLDQLGDLIACIGDLFQFMTSPYDKSFHLRYNAVLWTIKLEFRCSLLLFLTHAGLYYMNAKKRIAILAILTVLTTANATIDMPTFYVGNLIAEIYHLWDLPTIQRRRTTIFWLLILGVGAWLGSCTAWKGPETPIYAWQWAFSPSNWPKARFWNAVGACICVFAISRSPTIQKIYTTSIIQYLGRLSFAMYLVHFYIVQGIGEILFYYTWSVTGKENIVLEGIGFIFVYIVTLSIVVWVADIFMRVVDTPSIKLGSKLQKLLFVES